MYICGTYLDLYMLNHLKHQLDPWEGFQLFK